ncbi:MAG: DNA-binding response regulator [Flavobacteriaceae bacterium CG2_30_34_30]|nr:MAG: DNA-binding response regulator [Flavobacteriaceae bacterium CG2_30_34_30]PIV49366.1 MAG: DNA-binding response regulator [Flavobacteriaceae bacterium CG02_land_8_20_14_3_00_34_13]
MNTIIIEDEKPAARRLERMLEKQGVRVITVLHSVEDAINWFQINEHPDVLFLDIQLSDGLSFEIFEKVKIQSAIIFTTAFDEYALQAFKVNSVDYLLKPIDEEELQAAVHKYQNMKTAFGGKEAGKNLQINFEEIKKLLINPLEREYKKRFTIKIGQHLKMIPTEEICCFYSENKGTYLYTSEGRNYLMETTLDALEKELSPKDFFRVNRKFIVHIHGIQDIVAYSNSRLKLKMKNFSEEEIIVARERVKDFKDWLQ